MISRVLSFEVYTISPTEILINKNIQENNNQYNRRTITTTEEQ